jgi:ABC-type transport system involved in Fe-S cluster assembly fused permease/ATPase subunit
LVASFGIFGYPLQCSWLSAAVSQHHYIIFISSSYQFIHVLIDIIIITILIQIQPSLQFAKMWLLCYFQYFMVIYTNYCIMAQKNGQVAVAELV